MPHLHPEGHTCCPETTTSHPHDPIPVEPKDTPDIVLPAIDTSQSSESSSNSIIYSYTSSNPDSPQTPATDPLVDDLLEELKDEGTIEIAQDPPREQGMVGGLIV